MLNSISVVDSFCRNAIFILTACRLKNLLTLITDVDIINLIQLTGEIFTCLVTEEP